MANQLFANSYPSGVDIIQRSQIINGTVVFGGSYGNPEPLVWNNIIGGYGYNQAQPINNNGKGGSSSALITALSASGGVITATAANRFSVGQNVTFVGCTTTLGLLLNGLTFQVASATSSQFTFNSSLTGSGSSETGLAVTGNKAYVSALNGPTITATVTSLAVSGGIITVTAANNYLPGATVTFAGLTTTLGLLLNGVSFTVQSASSSAFKFASTLTGSAGSDSGTATGNNPPAPYSVQFWSTNGSGYVYQYSENNGNLVILQSGSITPSGTISAPTITTTTNASTANPLYVTGGALTEPTGAAGITGVQAPTFTGAASTAGPLVAIGTGALPSGVTGDIVHFQAYFSKDR